MPQVVDSIPLSICGDLMVLMCSLDLQLTTFSFILMDLCPSTEVFLHCGHMNLCGLWPCDHIVAPHALHFGLPSLLRYLGTVLSLNTRPQFLHRYLWTPLALPFFTHLPEQNGHPLTKGPGSTCTRVQVDPLVGPVGAGGIVSAPTILGHEQVGQAWEVGLEGVACPFSTIVSSIGPTCQLHLPRFP